MTPNPPTVAAILSRGLRYVRSRADIGILVLVKALTQVGSIDVMIAFYAERVFVVGNDGRDYAGCFVCCTWGGSHPRPTAG